MLVAAAAVLLAPLRCQCSVSLFSFPMISLSLAGRCYNRASCSAALEIMCTPAAGFVRCCRRCGCQCSGSSFTALQ
eukprot:COSAG03_NODE_226_length_10318_cov_14.007925_5_plen_76_part_00